MEYKLNVKITAEDYIAFNFDYLSRDKKLYLILFFVLLMVFGLEMLSFKNWASFFSDIWPFYLLFIFYIFYFAVFIPKRIKKNYKSDNLVQENQELTLSETGIAEKTPRSFCEYYTDDFKKVIFGKKVISIYISAAKAIVIPRHCFSSKEEELKIEEFIKTHYVKAK